MARRRLGILAALASLALSGPLPWGSPAAERDDASASWIPLAKAGDVEAQYRLGLLYDLGTGVPEDAALAYRWYRSAAEAGFAAAEFNVAVMLDSGRGIARERAQAALWYARAAAQGHNRAQYNLAQLYETGDGVPRNPEIARVWYKIAAERLPAASRKLEQLRAGGDGAVVEPAAAAPLAPPRPMPVRPGLSPLRGGGSVEVELVWTAPGGRASISYFVELVALDDPALPEIYAGYSDASAVAVNLDARPRSYAWRVFAVDPASGAYAVSDWSQFVVARAA